MPHNAWLYSKRKPRSRTPPFMQCTQPTPAAEIPPTMANTTILLRPSPGAFPGHRSLESHERSLLQTGRHTDRQTWRKPFRPTELTPPNQPTKPPRPLLITHRDSRHDRRFPTSTSTQTFLPSEGLPPGCSRRKLPVPLASTRPCFMYSREL